MAMKKILSFSLLVVLVLAFSAYAQSSDNAKKVPRFYSEFNPVIGGWSEYQVNKPGETPYKVKLSIVGKEDQAYWYETVIEADSRRLITKVLAIGDPNNDKNVKRMIEKYGDEPATEMPVVVAGQSTELLAPIRKVINKGMENITVTAGTFLAQHLQYQEGEERVDTWVSDKVSPYDLVKSQSKEMEMVLLRYGTGAKSLITEKPEELKIPKNQQEIPQDMAPIKNLNKY